jgi:FtsH-binding integral membrane protein
MAAQKKLEAGSHYEHFDKDGDGVITDEEFELEREMMRAENEDKKEDQIRRMAWFALWGLLVYPVGIVVTDILPFSFESTSQLLADIAPTYFVSVSALVGAFFGAQAYQKAKTNPKK